MSALSEILKKARENPDEYVDFIESFQAMKPPPADKKALEIYNRSKEMSAEEVEAERLYLESIVNRPTKTIQINIFIH